MTKTSHDSETPAVGQQVITACAFIHRDNGATTELFLPRRAATKKFLPGVFELPGGHIDYGEDIVAGLRREVMEEFGLETVIGDPFAAFTYANPVKGSHSVEVIYFGRFVDCNAEPVLHPEDHSEYRWVAETDLEEIAALRNDPADPELAALRKGFALLRGETPNF